MATKKTDPAEAEAPKEDLNFEKNLEKSSGFKTRVRILHEVFDYMLNSHGKVPMLLAGDPGIGKTTFMKDFSVLTGLRVIVVEAPHIAEEHIINIPFIVFEKGEEKKQDEALIVVTCMALGVIVIMTAIIINIVR